MTREDSILYFSPKFPFATLDLNDPIKAVEAFRDRIEGFYLEPARLLRKNGLAFACGLICCAAIDFLARYSGIRGKNRIAEWLKSSMPDFRQQDPNKKSVTLAERFSEDFRHGLVHEGRIRNLGEFSLETEELVKVDGQAMIVNPGLLLDSIQKAFDGYCATLDKNGGACSSLVNRLRNDFSKEIKACS